MAFRKKSKFILDYHPDLLIVPECENYEKLIGHKGFVEPKDFFWFGDNPNKGIGVFAYSNWKITKLKNHNPEFRYIIPLQIETSKERFYILAIWCQKPIKGSNYGIYTWDAIKYYKNLLKEEKVIIVGDLNSSSIWDKKGRAANHSNIVKELLLMNIECSYHRYFNEFQGM